jgi:thioredoxin reductase
MSSSDRTTDYDLIVVGGGSAGSACAAEAVKCGHERVALINDGELGGLCILRGCMPTKSMLQSVELLLEARHAERFGLDVEPPTYDFTTIMERRREHVERFQRAKIGGMQSGGYELIDGRAHFVGPDAIEVCGQRLTARAFMLSTGSRQNVPPVPGLAEARPWTSDDLMELESPPKSLLVMGAGAIGLEFSTFFAALGVETTLVNRSLLIERGEEPDLSEQYRRVIERSGVRVELGLVAERFRRTDDGGIEGCFVDADGNEQRLTADELLLATGRARDRARREPRGSRSRGGGDRAGQAEHAHSRRVPAHDEPAGLRGRRRDQPRPDPAHGQRRRSPRGAQSRPPVRRRRARPLAGGDPRASDLHPPALRDGRDDGARSVGRRARGRDSHQDSSA